MTRLAGREPPSIGRRAGRVFGDDGSTGSNDLGEEFLVLLRIADVYPAAEDGHGMTAGAKTSAVSRSVDAPGKTADGGPSRPGYGSTEGLREVDAVAGGASRPDHGDSRSVGQRAINEEVGWMLQVRNTHRSVPGPGSDQPVSHLRTPL